MAKIYKRSDRIPVRIDDIVIYIAPLTADQKAECNYYFINGRLKNDVVMLSKATALVIKYGVKGIKGVVGTDDKPYTLTEEQDALSDSCVDDLLNLEVVEKLTLICATLLRGIPAEFSDEEGKPLVGVSFVGPEEKEQDSKNVST